MAQEQPAKAYHHLADLMGAHTSMAIFRRFGPLNMVNLLSLQAELVDLDAQYRRICTEDDRSSVQVDLNFSSSFYALRTSESQGNDEQYKMLLRIRRVLHEYNSAVFEAAQLANLPRPKHNRLQFLREWLSSPDAGGGFLQGVEAYTWDVPGANNRLEKDILEDDLITLKQHAIEDDAFSRFLNSKLQFLYHVLWGQRKHEEQSTHPLYKGMVHYDAAGLSQFNTIVVTIVSSALPILSIVVLYAIKSTAGRIGAAIGFTTVFAAALAIFTNARRLEIFASTSTFAAVEVVFIGTALAGRD